MAKQSVAPITLPTPTVDTASVIRRHARGGHLWFSVSAPMHLGHVAMNSAKSNMVTY